MVEVSIVIPTTIQNKEDVPAVSRLDELDFRDYEVIVRRDEGASTARNEGIKRASSNKIVFLDDDSIPQDGYLDAASQALNEHYAVTGRVIQPPDSPFSDMEIPWYDQGNTQKSTELVAGCNMAVRKDIIEEIGGFNETFYHGHEETELAHRLRKKYEIYYHPEMVVEHAFADSVTGYWRKEFRHGKADALWWEYDDWPIRKRIAQSISLLLPFGGPVKAVGNFVRFYGRLVGIYNRHLGTE